MLLFLCNVAILQCSQTQGIERGEFGSTSELLPLGMGGAQAEEAPVRLSEWGSGLWLSSESCSKEVTATEELIVGCMLRTSCDPLVPSFNASDCITYALQSDPGPESCAKGAASCQDVEACLHRGRLSQDEQALCDGGELWRCDGQDAIHCTDAPYKQACEELGAVCQAHHNKDYAHVLGCAPKPTTDCAGKDPGLYFCDGDDIYTCVDGEPHGYDCEAVGATCVEDLNGDAYCTDRRDFCPAAGTLSCEGEVLAICDASGRLHKHDCSLAGLVCSALGPSEGSCQANGCAQDLRCSEGCEDETVMRICIGGATVHLDCAAYGFSGCSEGALFSGTPYATCL